MKKRICVLFLMLFLAGLCGCDKIMAMETDTLYILEENEIMGMQVYTCHYEESLANICARLESRIKDYNYNNGGIAVWYNTAMREGDKAYIYLEYASLEDYAAFNSYNITVEEDGSDKIMTLNMDLNIQFPGEIKSTKGNVKYISDNMVSVTYGKSSQIIYK